MALPTLKFLCLFFFYFPSTALSQCYTIEQTIETYGGVINIYHIDIAVTCDITNKTLIDVCPNCTFAFSQAANKLVNLSITGNTTTPPIWYNFKFNNSLYSPNTENPTEINQTHFAAGWLYIDNMHFKQNDTESDPDFSIMAQLTYVKFSNLIVEGYSACLSPQLNDGWSNGGAIRIAGLDPAILAELLVPGVPLYTSSNPTLENITMINNCRGLQVALSTGTYFKNCSATISNDNAFSVLHSNDTTFNSCDATTSGQHALYAHGPPTMFGITHIGQSTGLTIDTFIVNFTRGAAIFLESMDDTTIASLHFQQRQHLPHPNSFLYFNGRCRRCYHCFQRKRNYFRLPNTHRDYRLLILQWKRYIKTHGR